MKWRQNSSDNNFTKTSFWPLINTWGKNENLLNLIGHLQDMPIQILEYKLATT